MGTLEERHLSLVRAEAVAQSKAQEAKTRLDAAHARLSDTTARRDTAREAKEVLDTVASLKREEVSKRVESLVEKALAAVFGRKYGFRIDWDTKRGVSTAELVIIAEHGGEEFEAGILEGHGGGVADVVSFVLRLIVAMYAKPALAKIIVADEPFRMVAQAHMPGVAKLLTMLTRKTGWRFLIVTHEETIAACADRVYRVVRDVDGRSRVALEEGD